MKDMFNLNLSNMKKLLLICLVMIPMLSYSQAKKVNGARRTTPTRTVKKTQVEKAKPIFTIPSFNFSSMGNLSTSEGKEYVVYELEGWKQKELYDKMVLGISKLFTYPDKVMTKVENELITVNGYESEAFRWSVIYVSYYYSIKFQFKDGKIRIDPVIRGYEGNRGMASVSQWMSTQGNYNEVKPKFESAINNLIYMFLQKSFDTSDDDW